MREPPRPPSIGMWLLLIVCGGALTLSTLPAEHSWMIGVLIASGATVAGWVVIGFLGRRLGMVLERAAHDTMVGFGEGFREAREKGLRDYEERRRSEAP